MHRSTTRWTCTSRPQEGSRQRRRWSRSLSLATAAVVLAVPGAVVATRDLFGGGKTKIVIVHEPPTHYRRAMPSDELAFALELADLADSLSLPRFRALDLRIETKPDLTPVTDVDRSVERAVRERVAEGRRGEGVFGEEEGDDGGPVRWIVDPIDGTKNFARGVPIWATLIALERDGEPVCSVVSAPALGHRWWAARGQGAFRDGEPIRVSAVSRLADAAVSATYGRNLTTVEGPVWHARSFGDFWQHMLVAEGSIDAALDARLAPWDYAALAPIVEEAGGRVSALDGGPPQPKQQVISTNGALHDEVLALLNQNY